MTGRCDGPAAGLAVLDQISDDVGRFQPYWATRAHLLEALGHPSEAAYRTAIALTGDRATADFLRGRLELPGR